MNSSPWARKGNSQSSSGLAFVLTLVLLAVLMALTIALSGSRGTTDPVAAPAADEPQAAANEPPAPSRKRQAATWVWRRAMSSLT